MPLLKKGAIVGSDDRLVNGCLDEWPVEDLALRIGASVVVTCSAIVRTRLQTTGAPVEYFPQRFGYVRLDEIIAAIRSGMPPP